MYDVSLDRITIHLPNFARYIRKVLGVNDAANLLVSPYISIDIRDGGSQGYALILHCYDKTHQSEMDARVTTGNIVTMDVTLVTDDEHMHLATRIPRAEAEKILMQDNFFIGENPSARPLNLHHNEWKYPSTVDIPAAGWGDYTDEQHEDWEHDSYITICAIHAEAWEEMGMSEREIEAALGVMTEHDLHPVDHPQD